VPYLSSAHTHTHIHNITSRTYVPLLLFPVTSMPSFFLLHSCAVHLDITESLIYPPDAQIDCSKNVKIYIKIYMRGAPTCFGFSQPSSGSYYTCFAKVISINNQLKYVVYRICSV